MFLNVSGVTQFKIGLARRIFDHADTDSSQVVELREFADLLQQKCMLNSQEAESLFKSIDSDGNSAVHLDEFCHAITVGVSDIAKSVGLGSVVHFKFHIFSAALEMLGMNGDDCLEYDKWVHIGDELQIPEEDCQTVLTYTRSLMRCVTEQEALQNELTVKQICHALAVEGTAASDLHSLLQVKHALLRAVYTTIDEDHDSQITAQEFIEATVQVGPPRKMPRGFSQMCSKISPALRRETSATSWVGISRRRMITIITQIKLKVHWHSAVCKPAF